MTEKPNCSNCPNLDCTYNPKYHDSYKELGEVMADENIQAFVKWNGCFNHPGAKEWLMRDVIVELERKKDNAGSQLFAELAYGDAIAIIRGEK